VSEISKLVEEAREKFRLGDPAWPTALVADLETADASAAYRWGLECLNLAVAELRPGRSAQLDTDLRELVVLEADATVRSEELLKRSEEIWYRPGRDLGQTAVARLFAAVAHLKDGEVKGYQREVGWAIKVACDDPHSGPALVEAFLESYTALRSRHATPARATRETTRASL
jgi:hypothetical protein